MLSLCAFFIQVFGDVSIPGMDKDIKDAMAKGTKGIENLMGSQTSLNRRVSKSSPSVEPPHDKTNKMTVPPAKTRISLGFRPV